MPEFGAVITEHGQVLHSSVAEALYISPSLAALPGVTMVADEPMMNVPAHPLRLKTGAVFTSWGGRFNYGHFLLDCLAALCALSEAGLLKRFQPIAPPLNTWQQEALRLLLGHDNAAQVRQITEPVVRVQDLVFASPMDHFLRAPNTPLDRVREKMLANVSQFSNTGLSRLYLSRQRDEKRRMINEAELQAALQARGFEIIHPQNLPVARQIALFRDADLIVAPTGAALANTLFCKPGAKVFEIQPINYVVRWVRAVCHMAKLDWHGFFAASPLRETEFSIEGVSRHPLIFEWEVNIPEFIKFLDEKH